MSWNLNSKVSLIPILFWEYPKHKLVITQEMLNQHIQYICIFQVKDLIWLGFKKAFNKQINYTNIMYTYNHIWKSSYKQHEGSILAITHLLTLCSKTKVTCIHNDMEECLCNNSNYTSFIYLFIFSIQWLFVFPILYH